MLLMASTNVVAKFLVDSKWEIKAEKSISDVLTEHNIPLESVDSVIWSHSHFDHIGDPHLFPSTTSLTVGPGFKQAMTPGYPTNPESPIPERAYKDREFVEITFQDGFKLGQFRAFDYFGDGSFYLLDAPGHAVGHLCGLARTTPDTFVFMGGDICHHNSVGRVPYVCYTKSVLYLQI
jgi:glyoxylase-like metal-dependent hydrolase (beta-lactamase superfamily II)